MSSPSHHAPGAPVKKKRGAVFIVIVASIAVHLLVGGILAVIKITEVLTKEPEFEAPLLEPVQPPEPPPPPPPTTQRTQKSMPRPEPLAAQNPQNMEVPSIEIDRSKVNMLSGRGFGGGLGEVGGGVIDTLTSISFYGAQTSGSNFAVIMDMSSSGKRVYDNTSRELIKTLDMIQGQSANFMLIFFGGRDAGRPQEGRDFRNMDFWYPSSVSGGEWLSGTGTAIRKLRSELESVDARDSKTYTGSYTNREAGGVFFRQGTQFWGALDAAFQLDPPPDTVFLLVEPGVAFQDTRFTSMSLAWYEKFGTPKPSKTEVHILVGAAESDVSNIESIKLMLRGIHGGKLSDKKIEELITYTVK